jgi:sugar/nucleoside kinase (ribokinase family)
MSSAGVVVVGDLLVDVLATLKTPLARGSDAPGRVRALGGGAGANVAAWLAELGAPVCLVTRIGADATGTGAVAELRAGGVDVRATRDAQEPTGTCIVLVEPGGERTMVPDRGANSFLSPADLPDDAFRAGGHLHLSGYVLLDAGCREAGRVALERARAAGMTTSVDPASAALLQARPGFASDVGALDLLLPNQAEAAVLSGVPEPERAARALAATAREVVVKLGAAGAFWTDGARVVRRPSAAATVLDTTGAGDGFAAGFLAAWLAGADAGEALESGNALAARVVARSGARPGPAGPGAPRSHADTSRRRP